MWLEEMLPQDNLAAYCQLAQATRLPLCLSERFMTRWGYREIMEKGVARIAMPDICWCGGLTEAKRIATFAETYYLPVAPHNCGGPILHFASAHLAANVTNLYVMESVRRHYASEYGGLTTGMLQSANGMFPLPAGPGLGIALDSGIAARPGAVAQKSCW